MSNCRNCGAPMNLNQCACAYCNTPYNVWDFHNDLINAVRRNDDIDFGQRKYLIEASKISTDTIQTATLYADNIPIMTIVREEDNPDA